MFNILVKATDEIKWVISFWKLHANISFLTCLLVDEEDCEEAAWVSTALDHTIIAVGLESTWSEFSVVFINKQDAALRRT